MATGVQTENEPANDNYQHPGKNNKTGEEKIGEVRYSFVPIFRIKRIKDIDKQQREKCCEQNQSNGIALFKQVRWYFFVHCLIF